MKHTTYSRTTYQKTDLLYGYGVCQWCGSIKHTLYRYNDDTPIKLYCNKSCYESSEVISLAESLNADRIFTNDFDL